MKKYSTLKNDQVLRDRYALQNSARPDI